MVQANIEQPKPYPGADRGSRRLAPTTSRGMRALVLLLISSVVLATSCAGGASRGPARVGPVASGDSDASVIYSEKCAVCHGDEGLGRTAMAVAGTSLTAAEIVETVANGASGMPAFESSLSDADLERLAEFVLSFPDD